MERSYRYTTTRKFDKVKITLYARYSDDCANGENEFVFTADVWERNPRTRRFRKHPDICGCCHDYIVKYIPSMAKFLPLHLSDRKGRPMYYVSNTCFWLKNNEIEKGAKYLNTDIETAKKIKALCDKADIYTMPFENKKQMFDEILNKFGILEKWQKTADECLAWLEKETK